jgi:hypothetical protein
VFSRIIRVEVLSVLGQDFIRTARAKRLAPHRIYSRHALPNGDFAAGAAQWTALGASFAPASDLERPTHLAAAVVGQAFLTQSLALGGTFDVAGRPGAGQLGAKL